VLCLNFNLLLRLLLLLQLMEKKGPGKHTLLFKTRRRRLEKKGPGKHTLLLKPRGRRHHRRH
jgi:hypothetical protein